MKINNRIRQYIENRGLKFSFIAERASIDDSKFSRMMTNQQAIKTDEYEKICKVLELPTSYFFDDNFLELKN
ncbi:helix-turn-helix domain-containing protein [Sporolactobacillus shoreicorticis]|uniref:XRE family transcriptional regulator n=2 Tax=Sporolactobacillus TaxID=2077 RepID=A0A4Z0GNV1_9BACL|nr:MULTISPECIES: helix-turn-helix transcriptional regulator [Sporolactobacillus]MCO7126123.1 helix-turn-helix domain-containing protein [Sporolactobacillus shoreicorticis]TGA98635.1 XRE family transcriptional regulator [Sporolactobacillus shoreae]